METSQEMVARLRVRWEDALERFETNQIDREKLAQRLIRIQGTCEWRIQQVEAHLASIRARQEFAGTAPAGHRAL